MLQKHCWVLDLNILTHASKLAFVQTGGKLLKICHDAIKQNNWRFIYVVFILLNTFICWGIWWSFVVKQQSLRKGTCSEVWLFQL